MENEILNICANYYERQFGIPISSEMKENIMNIARIGAKLDFCLSNDISVENPGVITIKLIDPIKKDPYSFKNLGSIHISLESATLSYNEQRFNDGIPHDSYCYVNVKGNNYIGQLQSPTNNFEQQVVTNFNEKGIIITNDDNNKDIIPFSNTSGDILSSFEECERIHAIKVATVNSLENIYTVGMSK